MGQNFGDSLQSLSLHGIADFRLAARCKFESESNTLGSQVQDLKIDLHVHNLVLSLRCTRAFGTAKRLN